MYSTEVVDPPLPASAPSISELLADASPEVIDAVWDTLMAKMREVAALPVCGDGYNDFFESVESARVAWAAIRIAQDGLDRYMDKPLPPLPGEYSQRTVKHPRGLFSAVKHAVPVEELARRFTTLHGGATLKGRCPLHEEKTASFVVWSISQRWQCFGACARGGDVIELARSLMDRGLLK